MRLSIFLIHKMHIIRTYQFHSILFGIFDELFIGNFLQIKCFMIRTGNRRLMSLQFQIEIIPKQIFVPLDRFFRFIKFSLQNFTRNLSCYTCSTNNQTFMVFLQLNSIRTRTHVKAFRPRF